MTVLDLRQGDIVIVEFPYTDRLGRERRPAVVVSAHSLGSPWPLVWVVMITSSPERWNGDVQIADYVAAGLRVPCVARTAKITNVELSTVRHVGKLNSEVTSQILDEVRRALSDEQPIH